MERTEFINLLKSHDFSYQYSDDRNAFRKGLFQANVIRRAVEADPALQQLLDDFKAGKEITA